MEWQEREPGKFVLDFDNGTALIRMVHPGGRDSIFIPQIIDGNGVVLSEGPPLSEFEEAEGYVEATVYLLDQSDGDEAFQLRLIETINKCIHLLPDTHHHVHRQRLTNIKGWLTTHRETHSSPDASEWSAFQFDWQEGRNGEFRAQLPFGEAFIIELKQPPSRFRASGRDRYSVRLVDSTGAFIEFIHALDFTQAEDILRKLLDRLRVPDVDEVHLDALNFTLDICRFWLTRNSDNPMELVRLGYIQNYLNEALP